MSKPNSKVEYLYRDAGNYKARGHIVLTGPATTEQVERLQKTLFDGECFVAAQVGVPDLFPDAVNDLDHCLHEFEDVEEPFAPTDEAPTDARTVEEFVAAFEVAAPKGAWDLSGPRADATLSKPWSLLAGGR